MSGLSLPLKQIVLRGKTQTRVSHQADAVFFFQGFGNPISEFCSVEKTHWSICILLMMRCDLKGYVLMSGHQKKEKKISHEGQSFKHKNSKSDHCEKLCLQNFNMMCFGSFSTRIRRESVAARRTVRRHTPR